mgnify:CR=1 FL=1
MVEVYQEEQQNWNFDQSQGSRQHEISTTSSSSIDLAAVSTQIVSDGKSNRQSLHLIRSSLEMWVSQTQSASLGRFDTTILVPYFWKSVRAKKKVSLDAHYIFLHFTSVYSISLWPHLHMQSASMTLAVVIWLICWSYIYLCTMYPTANARIYMQIKLILPFDYIRA